MGEPTRGNALVLPPEYIGRVEATRGTETSKYPEEKKSTEIALVAASERARCPNHCMCQAWGRCCNGVVGRNFYQDPSPGSWLQNWSVAEQLGKADQRG